MFKIYSIFLLILGSATLFSQQKIENIIIVTIDGLRWQEVFYGMDPQIASQKKYNEKSKDAIFHHYWDEDYLERRKKIMPFLWGTISEHGQIFGNRNLGNKVNATNGNYISYPGYSELFCGYADKSIRSNDYPNNPNINLLEFFNQQPDYRNKVAAFTSWEAFNRILNEPRSGFPIRAAFDSTDGTNPEQILMNKMLQNSSRPWGDSECFDVVTHFAAMAYLSSKKPKIVHIGYGNTDEWAHDGKYKSYLDAANQTDKWLGEIWTYVQATPEYKDKTALLITTDHGRGKKNTRCWPKHGKSVLGSDEVWFAILSPTIPARGEVRSERQLYLNQIAQTIANLLGMEFTAKHPVGDSFLNELRLTD